MNINKIFNGLAKTGRYFAPFVAGGIAGGITAGFAAANSLDWQTAAGCGGGIAMGVAVYVDRALREPNGYTNQPS